MTNWEKAYLDYKDGMKYKDIADKYNVALSTVKSWKARKWNALDKTVKSQKDADKIKADIVIDNDELTDQQKLFCLYYIQSYNATRAYQKAYGTSYESSNANGSRLLAKDSIKRELARLKADLQHDIYMDTKDMLNELIRHVKLDIKDFVEFGQELAENPETGETYLKSYLRFKDMEEVDGTLIDEIKLGREGVSVKLPNKQKALDTLLKYMGDSTPAGGDIVIIDEWDTDD